MKSPAKARRPRRLAARSSRAPSLPTDGLTKAKPGKQITEVVILGMDLLTFPHAASHGLGLDGFHSDPVQ